MNPILRWLDKPSYPQSFPFDLVTYENLEESLDSVLKKQKEIIQVLLNSNDNTFNLFLLPLLEAQYQVELIFGVLSHLKNVLGEEPLQKLYEINAPKITLFYNHVNQDSRFITKIQQLQQHQTQDILTETQKKVIEDINLHLKLQGAFLKDNPKKRVIEIQQKLTVLQSKFSNQVLSATESFSLQIRDANKVQDMPEFVLNEALKESKKQGINLSKEKIWSFTLSGNSYSMLMKFCKDSQTREIMYKALNTRCATGKKGNKKIVLEILNLRLELSQLLGFKNYAEYSLQTKMAKNPQEVMTFLNDLYDKSIKQAKKEFQSLVDFKKQFDETSISNITASNVLFYSERLKEQQFQMSEKDLKPYLPLPKVLQGLFKIVNLLYNVELTLKKIPTWNSTVLFYEATVNKKTIAGIYLDLHSRKGKQEGAWMDEHTKLHLKNGKETVLPIAYVNCNFTPFDSKQQTLLNYDETETLFHEFGHALHHILTEIDCLPISGISGISWDAVEVPSQFFENWIWFSESVPYFSGHFENQKPIPFKMVEHLLNSKNFLSGMQMLRQLELSMLDMKLHLRETSWSSVQEIDAFVEKIKEPFKLYPIPKDTQFYPTFSHIFCGEYAAGYYSYKWAEVLSSDCFSLFKKRGLFNLELSQSFLKNILSQGGSKKFIDLFRNFKREDPSIEALLVDLDIQF